MIISILGTSGAILDNKNCIPKKDENGKEMLFDIASYDLSIFDKGKAAYINATQLLLEEFDDKFVFIGTACAIKFQKSLLQKNLKGKDVSFEEVGENDLDDIFEKIYQILQTTNNAILDITHGFRHQPIMAIFASTLSQFLDRKDLKVIFAKEQERNKRYQYIYLDDYIEITQVSLLLSGFIKTLNFIPVKNLKLLENKTFESFSKALLSNDIAGVQKYSKSLLEYLEVLQNDHELKHLDNLIEQTENELKTLKEFDKKEFYEQYHTLAELTLKKNYLVVALAYLFEALREYCTLKFRPILDGRVKFTNSYQKNTAVMDTIGNFKRNGKPNKIQIKYKDIYKKNRSQFHHISTVYQDIRALRNDLAHINKYKDFPDIKKKIEQLLFKSKKIVEDKLLKLITT